MKFIRNIILNGLVLLLFQCDTDEVTTRNYPRLKTLPVTEISSQGAQFNGKFMFRGDFEILNFGFVWGESEFPTLENNDRTVTTENIQDDTFSITIESSLKDETTYYVRAFVVTNDFVVYGENITFISLGSNAPEVLSITPVRGTVGDTLSIQGNHFSFLSEQNVVSFNDIISNVVDATDTLLKVIVPLFTESSVDVSVSIFGNETVSSSPFELSTPTISQFTPEFGTDSALLVVTGTGFTYLSEQNRVEIGNVEATVTSATKTILNVIVPAGLFSQENEIGVTVAGNSAIASAPFSMLGPVILSFQPQEASIRESITITGENFSTVANGNRVYFGLVAATLLEFSATTLVVEVPFGIELQSKIRVETAEQSTESESSFAIATPILTGLSPAKATSGKEVVLEGNHFSDLPGDNTVLFDNVPAEIISESKTSLTVRVPDGISKRFINVMVSTGNQTTTGMAFEYVGAIWSRRGSFPGDPRIGATHFIIGNKIYVGMGQTFTTMNSDVWEYDLASGGWNRKNDFPGVARVLATSFTINGKGYTGLGLGKSDGTAPLNDFWEYDPATDTWSEIAAFPGDARWQASGGAINGIAYVGFGRTRVDTYSDVYAYDPGQNTWNLLPTSFPGSARSGAYSFELGGELYVGGGGSRIPDFVSRLQDFWKFTPQTNEWTQLNDSPTPLLASTAFSINNRAYVTLGAFISGDGATWEYEASNDRWFETEFNPYGNGDLAMGCSDGTKGYVLFIQRTNEQATTRFEIIEPYQ